MKTILAKTRTKRKLRMTPKHIPQELIYEMVDGKPIYYHSYKKVLTQEKTKEEVMGSSFLQAELVALLVSLLGRALNLRKYVLTTNELGFLYKAKNWRVLDIAIFEKQTVKRELLSTKYVKAVPKIVIEVDTKADLKSSHDMFAYVTKKTDDLLNAGVEKVIWILTANQKVMIAERGQTWLIARWNDTIPVIDDITINLDEIVALITAEED